MARKIAMTDGQGNLSIDAENVSYMESMGWKRIVPEEYDTQEETAAKTVVGIPDLKVITDKAPDAGPEASEASSPASDTGGGASTAAELAAAIEAAKTPTRAPRK